MMPTAAARVLETPVLIIGAGPVGLQLALDLGWRGMACLVVDQGSDVPVVHPRAAALAARTMEFCRRWGIAQQVRHGGFPLDFPMDIVYCTSLTGHLIDRQHYPTLAEAPELAEGPEKKHRLPQPFFDPILAAAVRRYPHVELRHRHRLERFEQDDRGVRARIVDEDGGAPIEVRAQYMVACDGVTSGVRDALGIANEGNPLLSYSVNAVFRAPGFAGRHRMGPAERYLFVGPRGTWANMTVVDGRDLWRFTLVGSEERLDLARLDMAAEIRKAIGSDAIPFEVVAVAPWRRSELIASTFRRGRIFLAGDAAHTMSPTGGMGMNTGAGDAVDLGWKLDAVLRGWGGPSLLDSYEAERRPVALRNMRWSSENFRNWISPRDCEAICDDTPEGERVRAAVARQLSGSLTTEWEQTGIQLGYRYERSPICVADGTPPPPDHPSHYVQTARPGSRAPHAWLADGRSTIDLFGRGFVLLRLGAAPPMVEPIAEAARQRGVPLEVVDLPDAAIARLYERRLVLVRPDGHVAWRADAAPDDALGLIDTARGAA